MLMCYLSFSDAPRNNYSKAHCSAALALSHIEISFDFNRIFCFFEELTRTISVKNACAIFKLVKTFKKSDKMLLEP